MNTNSKLDRVLELLGRLIEQKSEHRATDAAPERTRQHRRPVINPADFAGLTHEQSVEKLAKSFEEIIRERRLEMLNAKPVRR